MAGSGAAGPPIRFLLVVVGVWTVGRSLALWPDIAPGPRPVRTDPVALIGPGVIKAPPIIAPDRTPMVLASAGSLVRRPLAGPDAPVAQAKVGAIRPFLSGQAPVATSDRVPFDLTASAHPVRTGQTTPIRTMPVAFAAPTVRSDGRRFTLDAAIALRGGGLVRPVQPSLGGSQAYLIARRTVGDRIALIGRLTTALSDRRVRQGEASIGLGLRPVRALPVELVAERRVALTAGGRDAWQVRAVGSGQVERAGWRLEGYGQAGVAGARSGDLFADGEARLSRALVGPLRGGALVAGAAQPGAARLDVGPQLRVDLPGRTALLASYRVRVAGDAAPRSGPALILAASF